MVVLNFKKKTPFIDFVKKSLDQKELYPFQKELIKLIESDRPIVLQVKQRRRNWAKEQDINFGIGEIKKQLEDLQNSKHSLFQKELELAIEYKIGKNYKMEELKDRCTLVSYQNNPKLENFNIDGVTMLIIYNRNNTEKMQIHRLYKE